MQLRAEKEPHKWCDWGKLFRLSSDVKLHRKRHVCGVSPFKRTSRSVSRIESGFSGLCSAASLFFILNSPCCFIIVTGHRYLFHMSTCSTRTAVENILGQAESNSTFGSSSYGFVLLYLGDRSCFLSSSVYLDFPLILLSMSGRICFFLSYFWRYLAIIC